jgi:hypothetical protein
VTSLAERAAAIATQARSRPEPADDTPREWWQVTVHGSHAMEVFFCPPQSRADAAAIYPGCRLDPLKA